MMALPTVASDGQVSLPQKLLKFFQHTHLPIAVGLCGWQVSYAID
jgi:hypothetical protein